MTDSLRVALLNPVYWPEVRRGSERFARELADGLLARGHRPRIVAGHPGLPNVAVEDGVEVVRVPRLPEGRLRRRLYEDHLTHVPFAWAALARGDDDVAHALHPTSGLAAARWSQASGKPAVLSYMGIPHRQGLANRRRRLQTTLRAIAGARAVVALSRAAADGFQRWLGVEARVIAPPVDLAAFAPGPGRAPVPTILCAADAAEPRKRVGLLIEAFALVRRERPEARLVVSRPRDLALADRLTAAGEGIEVRDLDDRELLAAANREAWVAALPSIGEAFGLVLVEALACGTPVVASNREALPEVVDRPEIGALFDGDEPAPLARALLDGFELAADPATAAACRARAEDFSVQRCAAAYERLYHHVIR